MLIALLQAAAAPVPSPWDWAIAHLPVIGWPTVILGVWKASRFLTKVEERAVASEARLKLIADSNTELKQTLEGQVTAQRELAVSVHQLAEAMHHQSELHSEQLQLIREMSNEQKLLAQNQMTIMNGFQRVVEQLINVVSDNKSA
jgi:hypothetical protein